MGYLKFVALVGILGLINASPKTKPIVGPGKDKLIFEKIIYHSSHCYGTCPGIDLQIDSNRIITLKRDVWKAKGVTNIPESGSFKGRLDPKAYFNLIAILISSDYVNLKFPPVDCCDGVITTIVVYANGKRTILKSMTPPEKARKLISFLHDLGMQSGIPPTTEEIKIDDL